MCQPLKSICSCLFDVSNQLTIETRFAKFCMQFINIPINFTNTSLWYSACGPVSHLCRQPVLHIHLHSFPLPSGVSCIMQQYHYTQFEQVFTLYIFKMQSLFLQNMLLLLVKLIFFFNCIEGFMQSWNLFFHLRELEYSVS